MSALYGAIIDRLEFSRYPARLKRDSTGKLPGLMPVYILAIFADNDTYSLMLSPETASYSLKPIRLKPARLKFPIYGWLRLSKSMAAYGGGFGV